MAIASIKVKMRIGFQEDKDMFKKVIFSIIVISLLSITGCQDTSEKILGSWKSVSPSGFDGKTAVIVFEKNKLTANGNYSSSVGSGGLSSKTKYVRTTHEEAESINEKNNEPRKTSGRIW